MQLKKCHENKENYIVRHNNSSIFRNFSIGCNTNNDKYLIYINILSTKLNTVNKQTDNGETTTLYEAIGVCDEYKLLFDQLKLSTTYSKKEISNMLKHEMTLSGTSKTLFTMFINPDKIVKIPHNN